MISKDRDATAKARFEDDRSYITKDGREVLFGLDWKARKEELWERCGGRCEKVIIRFQQVIRFARICHDSPAERCPSEAVDPHHLVRRSEKRDDRLLNLKALCRFHHDLLHPEKQPQWRSK